MLKDNLRTLREAHGISQGTIARELGFSLQRYNHYETGKREPDEETLNHIAQYYRIPVSQLFVEQGIHENMQSQEKAVGEAIHAARISSGLSQEELAGKAGISRVSLGNYERGDRVPSIEAAKRIADALGMSLSEIYDENKNACDNTDAMIGRRIKAERAARKMTQEQLAEKVGLSTITIRQYEAGVRQPSYKILRRIAEALSISLHELLDDSVDSDANVIAVKLDTDTDGDLIKYLENIADINGYIKAMIRADIFVQKAKENK